MKGNDSVGCVPDFIQIFTMGEKGTVDRCANRACLLENMHFYVRYFR